MKRSCWRFVRGSCARIRRPMRSGEGVTSARQSISEGTIRLSREPPTRGFTELWNRIATKGMERKVGEVFDFNGVKLQVKDTDRETSCNGCYLNEYYRYWEE